MEIDFWYTTHQLKLQSLSSHSVVLDELVEYLELIGVDVTTLATPVDSTFSPATPPPQIPVRV